MKLGIPLEKLYLYMWMIPAWRDPHNWFQSPCGSLLSHFIFITSLPSREMEWMQGKRKMFSWVRWNLIGALPCLSHQKSPLISPLLPPIFHHAFQKKVRSHEINHSETPCEKTLHWLLDLYHLGCKMCTSFLIWWSKWNKIEQTS